MLRASSSKVVSFAIVLPCVIGSTDLDLPDELARAVQDIPEDQNCKPDDFLSIRELAVYYTSDEGKEKWTPQIAFDIARAFQHGYGTYGVAALWTQGYVRKDVTSQQLQNLAKHNKIDLYLDNHQDRQKAMDEIMAAARQYEEAHLNDMIVNAEEQDTMKREAQLTNMDSNALHAAAEAIDQTIQEEIARLDVNLDELESGNPSELPSEPSATHTHDGIGRKTLNELLNSGGQQFDKMSASEQHKLLKLLLEKNEKPASKEMVALANQYVKKAKEILADVDENHRMAKELKEGGPTKSRIIAEGTAESGGTSGTAGQVNTMDESGEAGGTQHPEAVLEISESLPPFPEIPSELELSRPAPPAANFPTAASALELDDIFASFLELESEEQHAPHSWDIGHSTEASPLSDEEHRFRLGELERIRRENAEDAAQYLRERDAGESEFSSVLEQESQSTADLEERAQRLAQFQADLPEYRRLAEIYAEKEPSKRVMFSLTPREEDSSALELGPRADRNPALSLGGAGAHTRNLPEYDSADSKDSHSRNQFDYDSELEYQQVSSALEIERPIFASDQDPAHRANKCPLLLIDAEFGQIDSGNYPVWNDAEIIFQGAAEFVKTYLFLMYLNSNALEPGLTKKHQHHLSKRLIS